MTMETQREQATKAFYAALGAPVVTGRKLRDFANRLADDWADTFAEMAAEGEKVAEQLQDRNVDLEQLQTQVEKLRDQLETVLTTWRETFTPAARTDNGEPAEEKTTKSGAKTAAAKKTAPKTAAKTEEKKSEKIETDGEATS